MTTKNASRWARAAIAVAALVPITIATTVGAAYATGEPKVPETVEVAQTAVDETLPVAEVLEAPAEASVDPTPEPENLAPTGDPQDPEGPTITLQEPSIPEHHNGWHREPFEVQVGATVGQGSIVSIDWTLSGATTGSGTKGSSPATIAITGEGVTTLTVTVTDSAEFVTVEEYSLRIDSEGPVYSITSPAEGDVYRVGDQIEFDFSCTDALSGVNVCAAFPYDEPGRPVVSGETYTLDKVGEWIMYFGASDNAANSSQPAINYTVLPALEPDITAPVVTVEQTEAVPASGWWNKAVEVDFVATDANPIQSFEYRPALAAGGWGPWVVAAANPSGESVVRASFQFFASGIHTMQIRATDSLGNVSEPIEYVHRVDKEVSAVTVSGFPGHFAVGEVYELHYSCADALSGVASCASSNGPSGTLLPTDEGEHSFTLTNTDVAGNTTTTTWDYTVGDDTTAPQVSVQSTASGWVSSGDAAVTIRATDALSGVAQLWVQADGADPISGRFVDGASFEYTVTAEGETVFTTYAVDAAGNSSAPQYFAVGIDRTAPTIDISKPANRVNSLVATKTFTQGEVVDLAFECADALSGVASCEAVDVTGSVLPTETLGQHTLDFEAVDEAGNRTIRSLEYTIVAGNQQAPTFGLASTGVEIWAPLLLIGGLMVAGVSFLAVSRPRR